MCKLVPAVLVLLFSSSCWSSESELQKLCDQIDFTRDPKLARFDLGDRYTVYFDEVGKSARSETVRQTFDGMAHTNPLDRPEILRRAVSEAKLARCPLLEQLDAFYLGDPITGCAPYAPNTCLFLWFDVAFLAAWAKLPAQPERAQRVSQK